MSLTLIPGFLVPLLEQWWKGLVSDYGFLVVTSAVSIFKLALVVYSVVLVFSQ